MRHRLVEFSIVRCAFSPKAIIEVSSDLRVTRPSSRLPVDVLPLLPGDAPLRPQLRVLHVAVVSKGPVDQVDARAERADVLHRSRVEKGDAWLAGMEKCLLRLLIASRSL